MNWVTRLRTVTAGPNHRWWAFGTVALGTFMSTLDSSIVNVSLPTILRHFNSNLATVQWVVLAFLLTITSLLLTFGRLADIWGRKRVFTVGYIIFTIGAVSSGFSFSIIQLIISRMIQAVGAAMLQANGLAITNAVFPSEQRGRALGMNGTIVATGLTLGPTIGGLLINAFGWQAIFWLNIPVGIVGITLAIIVLDESRISVRRTGTAARFDPAGAVLAALTLSALILGLNRGATLGWTSPLIIAAFACAALLLLAFIITELRVAAPVLDLRLFQIRAFATGTLAAFCSFLANAANVFLMPFYLQVALGRNPAQAGLLLIPTSLAQAICSPISGWLSDKLGARVLSSGGLSITCFALVWLSQLPHEAHVIDIVLRLTLLGIGIGIFNSPNTSSVFASIPRTQYGVAGGFVSMVRNTGQVIGQAVAGAILINAITPFVGGGGLDALRNSAASGTLDPQSPLLLAFQRGVSNAYLVSAALAAIGIVVSLSRGRVIPATAPTPPAEPSAQAQAGRAAD